MFTFTAKRPDWTVGGIATGFGLEDTGTAKLLRVHLQSGETVTYQTGNWTFWTSGTVAFQVDLDAANAA